MSAAISATFTRLEFAPPPMRGSLRGLVLAILAHAVLMAALTWGVNWRRDAVIQSNEAELWSSVPQQAAAKPLEAPPAPAAVVQPPKPQPVESKPPEPTPAQLAQAADRQAQADIAIAREKEQKQRTAEDLARADALAKVQAREAEKEKQRQLLADTKRREALRAQEQQANAEKLKAEQLKAQKAQALAQEKTKAKQTADAALATKRKEALAAQQEAKLLEALRQENLQRMAGLAGSTGTSAATNAQAGSATQSSGPSPSYAGRIQARIKPNIVFTEDVSGNPLAEVEVRTAPDGTIVNRRLVKPSGIATWDEAVLKAIDKTEVLPRDVDGRVPPSLVIGFRPKDLAR
jgi:colicin import membrane protein